MYKTAPIKITIQSKDRLWNQIDSLIKNSRKAITVKFNKIYVRLGKLLMIVVRLWMQFITKSTENQESSNTKPI